MACLRNQQFTLFIYLCKKKKKKSRKAINKYAHLNRIQQRAEKSGEPTWESHVRPVQKIIFAPRHLLFEGRFRRQVMTQPPPEGEVLHEETAPTETGTKVPMCASQADM